MASTVAVLSDIHGMLVSLDRALAEPEVAVADVVVVTGDHVWGPQPTEILDRLLGLGDRAVLVRGNADREVLQMSRGIDVGLEDDPVASWGARQLRPDHQVLLDVMPERVILDVDGFGPLCSAMRHRETTRRSRWSTVASSAGSRCWSRCPLRHRGWCVDTRTCPSCVSPPDGRSSTPAASGCPMGVLGRTGHCCPREE